MKWGVRTVLRWILRGVFGRQWPLPPLDGFSAEGRRDVGVEGWRGDRDRDVSFRINRYGCCLLVGA